MKLWLIRIGQVTFGAFASSLAVENLTRFAVFQFVPRIHDVQFALVITIISTIGGIFGAIAAISLQAAKVQRSRLAGGLALIFGGLGVTFSLQNIVDAPQSFDKNGQPFIEALAYYGFTLIWSTGLVVWGIFLLFKKAIKEAS